VKGEEWRLIKGPEGLNTHNALRITRHTLRSGVIFYDK